MSLERKIIFFTANIFILIGTLLIIERNKELQKLLISMVESFEVATVKLPLVFVSIPLAVPHLFGGVMSSIGYRKAITRMKKSVSWFESLVACALLTFGGTTMTALVLGQTPGWLLSHSAFPALFVAWWLVFFSPSDFFWGICNHDAFTGSVGLIIALSSGHGVTTRGVDAALNNTAHLNAKRIAESMVTCILCGTLSACGGGLLNDWLSLSKEKSFVWTPPSIFTIDNYAASTAVARSFICALLYYCLLNPTGNLPWSTGLASKEQGHLVIVLIQIGNYLAALLTPTLDLYLIVAETLLYLLRVNRVIVYTDIPKLEENELIKTIAEADSKENDDKKDK